MVAATIELVGNTFSDAGVLEARRRFKDAAYANDLRFVRTQSITVDSNAIPDAFIRIIADQAFLYRSLRPDRFGYTILDDIVGRLSGSGHTGIQVLQSTLWLPA